MDLTLLTNFGIAAVSYITSTSLIGGLAHYSFVKRDSKPITIDALPPTEHKSKPNLDTLNDEIKGIICEFTRTLGEVSHINLTNFYNRLVPTRIDLKYKPAKNTFATNYIVLDDSRDLRPQLIPYLLEQAVTIYGTDLKARGFERAKIGDSSGLMHYGEFITDAYIKILAERYFGIYDRGFFDMDRNLVLFIESLVGREYMERAFFRSRPDEIVDLLSIYTNRQDVTKMIRELDHLKNVRGSLFTTRMLSQITYRDIIIKLLAIAQKKLTIDPPETEKEAKDFLRKTVELSFNTYQQGVVKYSSSARTIRMTEDFAKQKTL